MGCGGICNGGFRNQTVAVAYWISYHYHHAASSRSEGLRATTKK